MIPLFLSLFVLFAQLGDRSEPPHGGQVTQGWVAASGPTGLRVLGRDGSQAALQVDADTVWERDGVHQLDGGFLTPGQRVTVRWRVDAQGLPVASRVSARERSPSDSLGP